MNDIEVNIFRVVAGLELTNSGLTWDDVDSSYQCTQLLQQQCYQDRRRFNQLLRQRDPRVISRQTVYEDLYKKDISAFIQKDFNVELYAIVLIYKNIYQGHIYLWKSPVDPDFCFVMGIRASLDSYLDKNPDVNLSNVSYYLLDAARQMSKLLGARKLTIVMTFQIMQKIASTIGFVRYPVNLVLIGRSIHSTTSHLNYPIDNMYITTLLDEPFILTPYYFNYYE